MISNQAEAIRGAVMWAFDQLSDEQVRELVFAPYVELRAAALPVAA